MNTSKHTEVTPEELLLMQKHHRQTEYTDADQAEVFNLVKKYLNPHQSTCTSCRNNLREAKTALNTFYLHYKNEIEARHKQESEECKTDKKKKK